jgi:putative hydrolase of the HAD superfamily
MKNDLDYIKKAFKDCRSVIFDLDDTIYPEITFLKNRYKFISEEVFNENWEAPYKFLVNEFEIHGRKNIFNKLISQFDLKLSSNDILKIFRSYENNTISIEPYPWFKKLSNELDKNFSLLIITNGNPAQQKFKLNILNLNKFFSSINCIFADEYGGKPGTGPCAAMAKKVALHKPIYIGDSLVDSDFCNNCNFEFLDVKNLK